MNSENDPRYKTFRIDEHATLATRSKDPVEIKYEGLDPLHFGADDGGKVHAFRVTNAKKKTVYMVLFWRNPLGDLIAVCDCISHLMCKHIVHAFEKYVDAVATGFIEK